METPTCQGVHGFELVQQHPCRRGVGASRLGNELKLAAPWWQNQHGIRGHKRLFLFTQLDYLLELE